MERIRELSLKTFESLIDIGYNFDVKNPQNLDVLREKPNCPAVYIFNHTITEDPLIGFMMVRKHAPERLANVIVPVSEKHSKFKNFPAYWALTTVGERVWGFETPRVVQSYRVRKEAEDVDKELLGKSSNMGKGLFRVLEEKLPTAPVVYISPEGTRSWTGQLLPAEAGVGVIAMMMEKQRKNGVIENGYFVNVATTIEGFKGKGFYFNARNKSKVACSVGEPVTAEEALNFAREYSSGRRVEAKVISHYLMTKIARMLPEDRQGVYHPSLVEDTFQGRFQLFSDEGEHAYLYDVWNHKRFDMAQV